MAKRRKRKKKNPSTAQWIVLGVGSSLGLGLIGYGIYLAVRTPQTQLPEGGVGPGGIWEYKVRRGLRRDRFVPWVTPPGGDAIRLKARRTAELAEQDAISYIEGLGGVAVPKA